MAASFTSTTSGAVIAQKCCLHMLRWVPHMRPNHAMSMMPCGSRPDETEALG